MSFSRRNLIPIDNAKFWLCDEFVHNICQVVLELLSQICRPICERKGDRRIKSLKKTRRSEQGMRCVHSCRASCVWEKKTWRPLGSWSSSRASCFKKSVEVKNMITRNSLRSQTQTCTNTYCVTVIHLFVPLSRSFYSSQSENLYPRRQVILANTQKHRNA